MQDRISNTDAPQKLIWTPSEIILLILSLVMLLMVNGLLVAGLLSGVEQISELIKLGIIINIFPVGGLASVAILRNGRRQAIRRWHPKADAYQG